MAGKNRRTKQQRELARILVECGVEEAISLDIAKKLRVNLDKHGLAIRSKPESRPWVWPIVSQDWL